jgi:hypothetical protein
MNNDLAIKIATLAVSTLGSAFVTWKILSELMRSHKESLRDEYKFAKDFLSELKSGDIHPYLSQLGYLAMAGDPKVDYEEIEYLLTLQKPRTVMQNYLLGRKYLCFFSTSNPPGFAFNKSEATRKLLKRWFVASFLVTYTLGFFPLILMSFELLSPRFGTFMFVFSSIMFFPPAFFSHKSRTELTRAEAVIKLQECSRNAVTHTKTISNRE